MVGEGREPAPRATQQVRAAGTDNAGFLTCRTGRKQGGKNRDKHRGDRERQFSKHLFAFTTSRLRLSWFQTQVPQEEPGTWMRSCLIP